MLVICSLYPPISKQSKLFLNTLSVTVQLVSTWNMAPPPNSLLSLESSVLCKVVVG